MPTGIWKLKQRNNTEDECRRKFIESPSQTQSRIFTKYHSISFNAINVKAALTGFLQVAERLTATAHWRALCGGLENTAWISSYYGGAWKTRHGSSLIRADSPWCQPIFYSLWCQRGKGLTLVIPVTKRMFSWTNRYNCCFIFLRIQNCIIISIIISQ